MDISGAFMESMDAQNVGYGAFFSNANFGDGDAGAGGSGRTFTHGSNYIPVSVVVNNLKEASMNVINNNTTTVDEKIRSLKNITQSFTSSSVLHKLAPFFKPLDEHDNVSRMRQVLKKLDREDFNPSSQDMFKDMALDLSGADLSNLGIDVAEFNSSLSTVAYYYSKAVDELFAIEKRLHDRLNAFDTLAAKIDEIFTLETNSASIVMFDGFLQYLGAFFDEQSIHADFTAYIASFKKFVALNKLMRLKNQIVSDEERKAPQCSICVDHPVTQVFVPCGHTFCDTCVQQQRTVCFICRSRFDRRQKLYFA